MKRKTLTIIALIASISAAIPTFVFAQPNKRSNSFTPGFWQPQAQVNPNRSITVILLNQADIPVSYSLTPEAERVLPVGGTANVSVRNISRISDIANINIYARDELVYDYNANPIDNQVFVRIRRAGRLARADKSVYIDEQGRVYSF
jgi:hypothetical protein